MKQGQDLKSKCGRARVHYDPSWSPSKPFQTFVDGDALNSFRALDIAIGNLKDRGFRFDKQEIWK